MRKYQHVYLYKIRNNNDISCDWIVPIVSKNRWKQSSDIYVYCCSVMKTNNDVMIRPRIFVVAAIFMTEEVDEEVDEVPVVPVQVGDDEPSSLLLLSLLSSLSGDEDDGIIESEVDIVVDTVEVAVLETISET